MLRPQPQSVENAANAILWAAPIAVLLVMYHGVLDAWWMADDSMLLLSAIRHGIIAHYVRPPDELGLLSFNLTPWLYASYGIDFAVGGLNPKVAYVHHLISCVATLAVLTMVLRRLLGAAVTAVVLVWFVLALPTSSLVLFLCMRHYVEGLLAAALCVLAYRAYLHEKRPVHLALSAGLYAWAMTAKEIYVPLGPLLVVHCALFFATSAPARSPSIAAQLLSRLWRACKLLWPYVILAAAYVLYRGYMLGFARLLRGYDDPKWQTQPAMLLDFPATWQWASHWNHYQSAAWLALVTAGIALWLVRSPRSRRWHGIAFGLAVATSVLAPVYPVLGLLTVYHTNPRYLAIPLLAFFVLAGWASRECTASLIARYASVSSPNAQAARRGINVAMMSFLALLAVGQADSAWHNAWPWTFADQIVQYRIEGEYELHSADRSLIVDATGPSWHHYGLQHIRTLVLGLPPGPTACVDNECSAAMTRQRALGGVCVRYIGNPPRLEHMPCTSGTAESRQ